MHTLIYAEDVDAARAFFRDVLQFPYADTGGGWLIFKSGPSELAAHPSSWEYEGRSGGTDQAFDVSLMCDDLAATMAELEGARRRVRGRAWSTRAGATPCELKVPVPARSRCTSRRTTLPPRRCERGPMNGALPFDPIDEAARQWALHWEGVPQMHAVTSLMRVQQLVIGRLDALLKPLGLTFARYEALVLLTFSSRGSLPLGKMGERLQVHPTSVTSIVDRLEAAGLVVRRRHPEDGRGVLAEITETGRALVERATAELVGADFGLGALDDDGLRELSALLRPIRQSAGDF